MTMTHGPRCKCKVCELTGCGNWSSGKDGSALKDDRCQHPPCREPEFCGWAAYCGATDIMGETR
jgi:hypothetical protein